MRFEVTNDDINRGVDHDGEYCAVALAAKRALGPGREVFVSPTHLEVDCHAWPLPTEAADFVKAFDQGKPVAPFAFEIEMRTDWLS